MIQTIEKDILAVEKGIILHCCNCIGGFGGLAGKIGQKWPNVREEYLKLIERSMARPWELLGKIQVVQTPDPDLFVVNMFTQFDIGMKDGRKTEYSAVQQCLERVNSLALIQEMDIHLPYTMGCGLGGGDWSIIEAIIHNAFLTANVNICKI